MRLLFAPRSECFFLLLHLFFSSFRLSRMLFVGSMLFFIHSNANRFPSALCHCFVSLLHARHVFCKIKKEKSQSVSFRVDLFLTFLLPKYIFIGFVRSCVCKICTTLTISLLCFCIMC